MPAKNKRLRVNTVRESEDEDEIPLAASIGRSPLKKQKVGPAASPPAAAPAAAVANSPVATAGATAARFKIDSDDDDDKPLVNSAAAPAAVSAIALNGVSGGQSETADVEMKSAEMKSADKLSPATRRRPAAAKKDAVASGPVNGVKLTARALNEPEIKTQVVVKEESKSVVSAPTKARRGLVVKEDNFEPINCWWEKEALKDGTQWSYLEHHGLLFTPAYQPHNVPVKFRDHKIVLLPQAEEVANYWCQAMESDYATKPKFISNLWDAFMSVLPSDHVLKKEKAKFEEVDFSAIKSFIDKNREDLKEQRKNFTKEEKEAEKRKKEIAEGPHMYALFDWLKEKVGSYKSEPPSLFRGRGEHPKMGQLKRRIFPDEVTLNCHADAPIPQISPDLPGHCWKDIFHDNTVSWLAYYKDSVNGHFKYVFLGAGSAVKGQKDHQKYEKARKLKDHIDAIRRDYSAKIRSSDLVERQLGTATYMLDVLALRVGNEKDSSEEADTVGCCSLRVEHILFDEENSTITLDFLGKDSIRYLNTVKVEPLVLKNLKAFCKQKKPDGDIFDQINPGTLNKYLKDMMHGLSAKVFRTYNASITLQHELDKLDMELVDVSNPEQIKQFYDSANRTVAILCNHQRSIPKQHESSMDKMKIQQVKTEEDIGEIKAYLKWLGGNQKKVFIYKPATQSIDEETVQRLSLVKVGMREDIAKKKLLQLEKKQSTHELRMRMKDENKTVSNSTSKQHYMDPRITVAFCKKWELPIEKLFNTGLRKKFPWAMYAHGDFSF